jgi:hypothetical protein
MHWGTGGGSRMGWGAARRWCRPFIGVVGRFGGGGRYFPAGRSPVELERLLDARPDFAASGDETARAAAGQLVQVKGRLGVVACGGGGAWR